MSLVPPIRILYVIDHWVATGGTERHLAYLLRHLDRSRFKCTVVVFDYEPNELAEMERAAGTEIIHLPVARYYTPLALFRAMQLNQIIRSRRIDIVQTFHYKADVYGAAVARLAGISRIVSSKRDAGDYKNSLHLLLHALARAFTDRYIAVSGAVAEIVCEKEGVTRDRITVIHNGVDLERFSMPEGLARSQARAKLGLSNSDFVIGMSAWLRPEKDHRLLIDAFLDVAATVSDAKLVLLGGGPLFEHYSDWVGRHGFRDRIILTGPVEDVEEFLQALDVACLVPKINEGFSNSVLEKMALGLPVIVTDVGGNREAVVEGVTGYVIAPGDRVQLAHHLLSLHSDPALRSRMGAAARARAENLFSLSAMIDRHQTLYFSMCPQGGDNP